MKKIINPWEGLDGYMCFGCAPSNPMGLHMEFYEDGDDIVAYWEPEAHYQGWLNTLHGGILTTLMDELAGWVVLRKLQTSGMTSRLDALSLIHIWDIFSPEVAAKFRTYVLSPGGIDEGMDMYKNFRGKEPDTEPLLKNRGLK